MLLSGGITENHRLLSVMYQWEIYLYKWQQNVFFSFFSGKYKVVVLIIFVL